MYIDLVEFLMSTYVPLLYTDNTSVAIAHPEK